MRSIMRSEKMHLLQLYLQADAAHDIVDELITLGSLEFRDMKSGVSTFQRKFVHEVRRWDEAERMLRYFYEELNHHIAQCPRDESMIHAQDHVSLASDREGLEGMEHELDLMEKELRELRNSETLLIRSIAETNELLQVLRKDNVFFDKHQSEQDETNIGIMPPVVNFGDDFITSSSRASSLWDNGNSRLLDESVSIPLRETSFRLGYISGIIAREMLEQFCRVLWRSSRGNIFLRTSEIDDDIFDPKSGVKIAKSVFVIFLQGDRLNLKVKKICETMGANLYDCPSSLQERAVLRSKMEAQLDEFETVLKRTIERRRHTLIKTLRHHLSWKEAIKKEKYIYYVLNMMDNDVSRKCFIGEAWCPSSSVREISEALQRGSMRSGVRVPSIATSIPATSTPPTHYGLDTLTRPFQAIVDAYGVARFGELNPTPFTIITFPFLFGIMFGDVGHGLLMLLYAIYLVRKGDANKKEAGEVGGAMIEARYMILLMSFFSVYVGAIYGEFFSLPVRFFQSTWEFKDSTMATRVGEGVYPFGVDPSWLWTSNELEFYNSLKMKLSIIFGVAHMVLGVVLSYYNHKHFNRPLSIYCEFIPQMLFMMSIFGYLVLLILLKWSMDWTGRESEAPLLVNTMIDMFLHPGVVTNPLYPGQAGMQGFLAFLAFICIPWMLLGKPLLQHYGRNSAYRSVSQDTNADINGDVDGESDRSDEEHGHNFWDEMTHQTIHTIEYVLGAVSNTASYLRLWALSLAHSELSKVFWEQIMMNSLATGNPFAIVVAFAVWAAATVAVLLMMESLSAFLHALRLHWVEFQNKFYAGDGIPFQPITYDTQIGPASSRS